MEISDIYVNPVIVYFHTASRTYRGSKGADKEKVALGGRQT